MSTKPFKVIVDEAEEKNEVKEDFVKPFKVESQEALDTSDTGDTNIEIESALDDVKRESSLRQSINYFSSINGIIATIFIFIFIAVIADAVNTIADIFSTGEISSYIYLSGLILLIIVFLMNISTNFKQIRFIKSAKLVKDKFKLQKIAPTKEIIPLANTLLDHYEATSDKQMQKSIEIIRDELNTSQIYQEIYNDLDNSLLPVIDKKAKQLVHNASIQAALSTAVSPVPMLDMILIVWRSTLLTREIASIYGFRPGGLTTMILLKQGVINVAFAGVAELATDFTNEMASSTVLAKVSQSAGQGIANGILLARFGYGVMEACRPIESSEKRENFIKSIIGSIFDSLRLKEDQK